MYDLINIVKMLDAFQITSVDLVKMFESNFVKYKNYNSIACISPTAMEKAIELDKERQCGIIRGPLHGVPILIKDNILYKDGTPSTSNSYSLSDLYPPYNSSVVNNLIEAGVIIVGKANQSELSFFMSDLIPSGYGSMYGQVKHPFDKNIDPLGSSTGCAVAVKLNIVTISLGTETNGSLMAPACMSQVTSFKPSFGRVSKRGLIPIYSSQDTAGPLSQTVYGCALVMDIIDKEDQMDVDTLNIIPRGISYTKNINLPFINGKVGILNFPGYFKSQDMEVIYNSKIKLNKMGFQVIDINMDTPYICNKHVLCIEFKDTFNKFIKELNVTKVKSLNDVIDFNLENSQRCLKYGQNILEMANDTPYDTNSDVYKNLKNMFKTRSKILNDIITENNLVAVGCPLWTCHAPIYGNPTVCIPEGLYDENPKAMIFVGKKYDDHTLIRFAHQYQTMSL